MAKKPKVMEIESILLSVRVPREMLRRIEDCGREFESNNPGADASQSVVLRVILARGLDILETEREQEGPRRRR
jgi:hypothetical protein